MPRDPRTGRPYTGSSGSGIAGSSPRPPIGGSRTGPSTRPPSRTTSRPSTRLTKDLTESDWQLKGVADKEVSRIIDVDEFDKRMHYVTGSILGHDTQLAFSPDSRFLFCGNRNIWVFDVAKKKLVYESERLGNSVSAIAVAKNSNHLVTVEGRGILRLITYDQNGKLKELKRMTDGGIGCDAVAISDDGKKIVSGSWSAVNIWDLNKDKPVYEVKASRVKDIYIDRAKNQAVAVDSRNVMIIDLSTGNKLGERSASGHSGAAFSHDGRKVAICSSSRINELNLENGEKRVFEGGSSNKFVRYHPDGRLISLSSGKITFWNPTTRFRLDEYTLGDNQADKLVVSPNGKFMATMSLSSAVVFRVE